MRTQSTHAQSWAEMNDCRWSIGHTPLAILRDNIPYQLRKMLPLNAALDPGSWIHVLVPIFLPSLSLYPLIVRHVLSVSISV